MDKNRQQNINNDNDNILGFLNANNNDSDNSNNTSSNSSINPEMINNLVNMLSSNSNNDEKNKNSTTQTENSNPSIDFEMMMKMKNIIDKMNNNKDDPRANLLKSLKPYLKDSRKEKVDQYIKLFNMSKVMDVFNSSGGDKKDDT